MKVILANPRGFCAGVDRAIEVVERALERYGTPLYVRHEVVHNRLVVNRLQAAGVVFIEELDEVPAGATLVFSAHGVSRAVREAAQARGFRVFDATCPLVTKVHNQVRQYRARGLECILVGHAGHPEVEGTMGQVKNGIYLVETLDDVEKITVTDPDRLAYVTQTTLSVDDTAKIIRALKARFPAIRGARTEDICYATQNRQDAVKRLAEVSDVILVVGSPNSSNSNRLRELAEQCGCPAYLIDQPEAINPKWLTGRENIGITAGASAPEELVRSIVDHLQPDKPPVELQGAEENTVFVLPPELRTGGAGAQN